MMAPMAEAPHMRSKVDLSPTSWGRVIATTIGGTLVCIAVALYVDSFNFPTLDAPR